MADKVRYADGPRDHCPWGRVTHRQKVAEGIFLYQGSNDHGGYWLSPERMAQLPEWAKDARNFCKANSSGPAGNWFEEDCDYSIIVHAFPAEFRAYWASKGATMEQLDAAMLSASVVLKGSHPLTYAKMEEAQQTGLPEFTFHIRMTTTTRGRVVVRGRDAAAALQEAAAKLDAEGESAFEHGADIEDATHDLMAVDLRPVGKPEVCLLDNCELVDLTDAECFGTQLKKIADEFLAVVQETTDSG